MIRKLLWCVMIAGTASAQMPVANQAFHISGRMVDALTGKPLSKIVVAIGKPQDSEVTQSVTTGADGGFVFNGLSQGKYWLVAEGKGISRQGYQEHGFYSTAIAVGPQLESDNIEFRVHPDSSIAGVITDQNNEPVRDAQVMLFRRGLENGKRRTVMQEEANTNDEGQYHFSHVRGGTYFLVVSAKPWYAQYVQGIMQQPGFRNQDHRAALDVVYPVTYYPGSTDMSNAAPITVRAGERVSADMTLTAEPAQHFTVSDPDAESEQGMNVLVQQRVFDGFTINLQAQTIANSPGEVEVTGVPAGHYRMQFESYGKHSTTREQEVEVSNGAEVRASGSITPAEVSGILKRTSAGGEPIVRLTNIATGEIFDGPVGKKGEFTIDSETLAPGKYEVGILNLDPAVVMQVTASGARASGQIVEISAGGAVRLTVTLAEQLSRVDGVALRDGKGRGGAMVMLVPQDMEHNVSLARRDQSDSDGTFSLFAVPPGKYTVIAIENGWELEWRDRAVIAPYLRNGTPITVSPGHKENITVTVQ
ncbi:MAG TPA: carboxypeptidase-like regulatory domain-containing protein [Terriglobales bacterium]|nr:carboxypeptidase-like regulatory domain-containing protein [Terriglobales bacterium]